MKNRNIGFESSTRSSNVRPSYLTHGSKAPTQDMWQARYSGVLNDHRISPRWNRGTQIASVTQQNGVRA